MSAPQQGNPAAGGQEDYLDKVSTSIPATHTTILTARQGMDALEKKQGQDPNKLRSVNEKVSDTARGMFEKATGTYQYRCQYEQNVNHHTGKNVPDKVSN